jgi:FMN-dependent oxidoreductase (nitrilotriacetate monooxygenase family)
MFHLAWFVKGFAPQSWGRPWSGRGAAEWMQPDLYVDLARALERACFDGMIIEDTSMVPDAYGGTNEYYLRNAHVAPKHDPVPLIPLISQATRHLGVAVTISTSFYPPFLLARLMTSLDHISGGRVGCNLVTSSSDRAAENYGLPKLPDHDVRYAMAEEWMDVVDQLWRSWDPDALVLDEEAGVFADHAKVRPIDFHGRYHGCRGPLNAVPSPQGRPVIVQAGGSPAGRDFGARHADLIMAEAQTPAAMKAYRDDIRARVERHGRDPDSCKVLFMSEIILGDSEDEARELAQRGREGWIERKLVGMSTATGIDFSKFDLDAPLPSAGLHTEGIQSGLDAFLASARERTLREVTASTGRFEVVGTPALVADQLEDTAEAVGGDGFLIINPITRRAVAEITDGLAPELRRRGLIRSTYKHEHFRDNLMDF